MKFKQMKNEDSFRTPVLLIVFNRPHTTRVVFEAIRKIRPPKLYVAADGPRPGVLEDNVKCKEVRKIVDEVNWDCQVKTLFHETNLNCGLGPSTAITWFFEHEEQGIILEDDCLPSRSFFWFCQDLLQRYYDDARVMHIGGNNFLNGWRNDHDYSYYFSRSGHVWGWATWRRAWRMFDFNIGLYEKIKNKGYFDNFFLNPVEKIYRLRKFQSTALRRGEVDWWDYQWDFARYIQSGLSIIPQKNLVKNIGFDADATHTKNGSSNSLSLDACDLDFPLRHPPFTMRDLQSDRKYFSSFMKNVMFSKLGWHDNT